MSKPKTYLSKREFVNKGDKNDKTVASAEVRRFEWGGFTAHLEITSPQDFGSNGGINIRCDPDNKESYDEAMAKAQYIIDCITDFKNAVKEAHKDSNSKSSNGGAPTSSKY
jgi:hypothetical protein